MHTYRYIAFTLHPYGKLFAYRVPHNSYFIDVMQATLRKNVIICMSMTKV